MTQGIPLRSDLSDFLVSMSAREAVVEIASLLREIGVPVVPLKGVLLQQTVYEDPRQRPLTDVDVLIPASDRHRAQRLLARNGWRIAIVGSSAAMLLKSARLPLDLHWALYSTCKYGPDSAGMIERAVPDREAFGVEIRLPLPEDTYAHLVGHFVKDRRDERQPASLIDLGRLARHARLDPARTARHLEDNGLGRAARYVLPLAATHAKDEFAGAVLARLRPDRLGERLATLALEVVRNSEQPSKLAALPVALLDRSLPHAASALVHQVEIASSRELLKLTRRLLRRNPVSD